MWEGFVTGIDHAFIFLNKAVFVGMWILWCALVANTIMKVNEGEVKSEYITGRLMTVFAIGIALWVLFPHYPAKSQLTVTSFRSSIIE